MSTIEDQIALEKRMVAYGVVRYRSSVQHAEEKGRGADTQYAQVLLREFVAPVADALEAYNKGRSPGPQAKYRTLLRHIDPAKAAYFGLRCLFNHFATAGASLHNLAANIGTAIEDEIKFGKFHEEHPEYYETLIKDFRRKNTKSYRHMHRVLTFKANEKEVKWDSWGIADKIGVGVKVIDIIMQATDLITKRTTTMSGKTQIEISPSAEALDWVRDYHRYAELLNPDKVPCVIPPDDWTSVSSGGYYTTQLRNKTPLVKTHSKAHADMFSGDISHIADIINSIQQVPWKVNQQVHDVLKQCWAASLPVGLPRSEPYIIPDSPVKGKKKQDFNETDASAFADWKAEARMVHTMERERVSKCFQVVRVLRLAQEYREHEKLWYVYQCDFRGRVYAVGAGMSPQGPDFGKALIQFANGKPLTKRGAFWLAVHGANCFGEDKLPYADRHLWTENNTAAILAVAEDPMSTTDFWGNADKPWQFLAFCFEWARFRKEGDRMMTYLPIGLDGSCNGLQNFSAMLRDEIGGKATNLVPQDKPADIYSEVAKVCTHRLVGLDTPEAEIWRRFASSQPGGILPRGLAKRPVMTLPYGSTVQSCREYIYKYMVEDAAEHFPKETRFRLSAYLTPILWDSIADVVISARQAMGWLQHNASKVAQKDKPIIWWTPLGFPVMQDRKEVILQRIKTELAGSVKIQVGESSGCMDVFKNRLAVAPNFVHSMDACHLMLTCQKAVEYGVTDFAFIHDDYGTHAGDVDTLHQAIREAFVEMYDNNDPLVDFKIFNEDSSGVKLTDPPEKGNLKLDQVIDSDYFFG